MKKVFLNLLINNPFSFHMHKKLYFTVILWFIIFSIIAYISWLSVVLESILVLIVYSVIFYAVHSIIQWIRKKERRDFNTFLLAFLYRVWISTLIICGILWGFAYYFNNIAPAGMPEFTVSNGEKTIVFQAMSHIGSEKFYTTIQKNITEKKQEWFVYFFEWVRPWSSENQAVFDQAMGIKFDKNLYKNFSKLYGVVYQDNSLFLNRINNLDFNVDLSIDDIITLYNGKNEADKQSSLLENNEVIDANQQIIETLANLNPRELSILRYINKAILNIIVQSQSIQDTLMKNFSNKALFDVILNERNTLIAKKIESSQYSNIYLTYGLLHFQWVFETLKQTDPQWKIISQREFFPIQ